MKKSQYYRMGYSHAQKEQPKHYPDQATLEQSQEYYCGYDQGEFDNMVKRFCIAYKTLWGVDAREETVEKYKKQPRRWKQYILDGIKQAIAEQSRY